MNSEIPHILPEDFPPSDVFSCNACELSGQRKRVVWGEGYPKASIFVVVDNPGARETREGTPFLCGTRETLQKAAYEAGLTTSDLYLSYILKCRPRQAYDKPLCRSRCIHYLWSQLEQAKTTVLMVLGNIAVQSIWDNPEAEVKHLRGTIHTVRAYRAVVSYHPLAVRRRPNLYPHFVKDWRLAAACLERVLAPN